MKNIIETENTVHLDIWEQHLILYCKNHYKNDDFFEGLKMIWAVRCGWDYRLNQDEHVMQVIANKMYKTILQCEPSKKDYLMEVVHNELGKQQFKPENMTPIRALIWEYRSILQNLQIKENLPDGQYVWLVKLPKPQKRIFNRILRGNGRFNDYDLIDPKIKK